MSTYYYIGCPVCEVEGPMLFADKTGGVLAAQPVAEQLTAAAAFVERHKGCGDHRPQGVERLVLVSEHREWTADREEATR